MVIIHVYDTMVPVWYFFVYCSGFCLISLKLMNDQKLPSASKSLVGFNKVVHLKMCCSVFIDIFAV